MKKEFVMRGKTASDHQEILNFSGHKKGYAYKLKEFVLYPSVNVGTQTAELLGTITAAKTFENPANPDFTNEGLIGTASLSVREISGGYQSYTVGNIVNDTFLITQDLILAVVDTEAGSPMDVNWQCRFESVKMSGSEEAVTNYRQFLISDE